MYSSRSQGAGCSNRTLAHWHSAKERFAEGSGSGARQSSGLPSVRDLPLGKVYVFFCLPFFSKTSSTKFFQIYFANALSNSLKNSYLMLLRKNPLFHAIIAQIQFVSTNYLYPIRVLLNLFECTLKIPCQIHSIVQLWCFNKKIPLLHVVLVQNQIASI